MYNQRTLIILARRERARIKKILGWMGHRRDELPVGSLKRNGKHYYRVFYEDGQKNHVMIPEGYSGKWALIDELRERRYISAAMPVLENNLRCIERFQKGFRVYDPQEISARLPQAYEGYDLRRICLPGDVDPQSWATECYECNGAYPEGKIYKSEGGVGTRSKAEADIATKLEQRGFSFRYEELIYVDDRVLAPDFSILYPTERRVKYWEHFGMMDDPEYAASAMDKICHYAENGIRVGDELILTWETRKRPLLFEQINMCIDRYLM